MEAPIPDEEIPAWQYLDIYLFSNGQENSPPRKYHLVSDNLEFWSETLKQLAQEQFGSPDYDISLYTTQGRLIKTPLELNHKKAYVAVRPPEEFIDAGYDRYLIRATRSWEKRQDKRSNNTSEKQGEDLMSGKSDPESIPATPSTTLKTIVPSIVDNLGSVTVHPRERNTSISKPLDRADNLGSVIVQPRDRNTSRSKPLDRAETTLIQQSGLSKKIDTALSPAKSTKTPTQRRDTNMHNDETADQSTRSKSPLKGRVHNVFQKRRNSDAVLSRVEEVVIQLENSSPRKVEQINAKTKRNENRARISMTKPVENEKVQQNKPKTIPHLNGNRPRILMTKPAENEKDEQRAKTKPFSNSIENRNRTAIKSGENVKIEQTKTKTMPHLHENRLGTKVVNPNHDAEQHFSANNHSLEEIVHKNENKSNQQNHNNELVHPVLSSSTEKKQKPRDTSDDDSKVGNSLNILNKNNDDPLKKKETLSHPDTSNWSKGIINMRIEVWNSLDVTRNASCEIKAPVIILTNEIGSQVDMAGPTGQNKMLHQVIASDKDGIDGNYKVILVRSSYTNNNQCESSKHSVIGECVMFLPVIKLDELYCRCSGGETNVINGLSASSHVNPVKKSASCTSVHKENANRISIDIRPEVIRPEYEKFKLKEDTIQNKTDHSEPKLSTNNKKFEESAKTLENSPSKLVESVKTSERRILDNNECTNKLSKSEVPPSYTLDLKENERETEYSVSQHGYGKPVVSEELKSKQIEMHATQPETKESMTSKISKFSEIAVASNLEKVKETKSHESVEIIPCDNVESNINEPEISSAHTKYVDLSKLPLSDSVVSKSMGIEECQESTLQSNTDKPTKASAVAEATSLLETRLEPAKPQAITDDKASQTEWTDVLWEAKLQEDGHYSFHLPTLSRLKEYNL